MKVDFHNIAEGGILSERYLHTNFIRFVPRAEEDRNFCFLGFI